MRMPRATVKSTTTATTMSTIRVANWVLSLFVYEGGRALDLEHLDAGAGLERMILFVRAGAPDLAAEPHRPAVAIDAIDHDGAGPDERGRAGAQPGGHAQMAARDRSQHQQGSGRHDREHDP